jgi:hypothetical protein
MIVEHANLSFARETLRSFMDSVALSRAIQSLKEHPYSFTVAQRAAFDTAVISWCILFGSDNAEQQQIHWKSMFEVDSFRGGLLKAVGMSLEDWRTYRQTVVDYRNELAAHRDLDPKTRFHPNFDTALLAADFYHERLREKVAAEASLKTEGGTLMEQFKDRLDVFTKQMVVAAAAVKGRGVAIRVAP